MLWRLMRSGPAASSWAPRPRTQLTKIGDWGSGSSYCSHTEMTCTLYPAPCLPPSPPPTREKNTRTSFESSPELRNPMHAQLCVQLVVIPGPTLSTPSVDASLADWLDSAIPSASACLLHLPSCEFNFQMSLSLCTPGYYLGMAD